MTGETEVGRGRSALAAARAWQAVELPPDLRRGVDAAAKAAGIEPEAWLTRTVLAAAKPGAPHEGEGPLLQNPNPDVARSLAMLLAAARARARQRQAQSSALTLVEPAPPDGSPKETPPQIGLTAERPAAGPAKQLPTLYHQPPQPRRHVLTLALLAILIVAAFGAGAFYLRYDGAPSVAEPMLTVALPPTSGAAPTPPPQAAAVPPANPSMPAPAASPSPAAPAPASIPPAAPEPASAAAIPPVPALPPADATTPATAQPAAAASAAPPRPPAPSPAADAQKAAAPAPAPPPPPPATSTAAALPPGVGPRVQPPPAPPEVVYEEYNLGVRYAFGTGVKQDYKKAADLFLKAAMQGLADAQYNLGALYDNGLGVVKDPVRAVIWYHSAAEQNHPSAELNLGLAYANGTGVAQDYAEAARWFRRAADQGVVTAQYNLAALYANGRGVEESRVDAYAWFNIAAASGDLEARDQMRRAAETMTAQQLKAARALSLKLAEGVKRPIPGTVSRAANSPSENPQTATAKPDATSESATAAPAAAAAQPSTLTQPVDQVQVAEIQRYLARLRFDPGPSDGVLSDQTAEAIRKYQTDRKLKVDGEASRALLFRLKADAERLQKP
jgi:TPR repeat protein